MMATQEQLALALRNADKAGDVDAARKLAAALAKMRGAQPAEPAKPESSAEGVMGAAIRGGGPYAAGAAIGGIAGTPAGGIGAIPGAALGAGTVAAAKFIGDPVITGINQLLGTNYETPTQSLAALFDRMGVPQAESEAEKVLQTAVDSGASALSMAGILGQVSQIAKPGTTLASAAGQMAAQPVMQTFSAGTGGAAGQYVAEQGGGPAEQLLATLLGGLVGGAIAPRAPMQPDVMVPQVKPTAPAQQPPLEPGDIVAAARPTDTSSAEFGTLVRAAVGGSEKAKDQVARLAAINPEAKTAAEKLGLNLPPDVISDARLLQETMGLSRAMQASPASVAWADTVTEVRNKADEVLAKIDANPDMSLVSSGVQDEVERARSGLERSAREIYRKVDELLPKSTTVTMVKTQSELSKIMEELGGMQNLNAEEKRLLNLATDPATTYGAMLREKSVIGEKLAGKGNGYPNSDVATLKRLYGAMADDQLEIVGKNLGDDVRNDLRYANQLTAKRKALEKRVVGLFGREGEGSIATALRSAIASGAKGDVAKLHKILKVIPKGMEKEVVASALMAQTRQPDGKFGFAQFVNTYQGLRKNSQAYSIVHDAIGDDGAELLRSLYVVSRRVNEAQQKIPATGKANQALLNSIVADGMVKKVLGSTVGRGAAIVAATKTGVPLGGAIASSATDAIASAENKNLQAAAKLLSSTEFSLLIEKAARRGADDAITQYQIRRLANNPAFKAYSSATKIAKTPAERELWLRNALIASQNVEQEQTK